MYFKNDNVNFEEYNKISKTGDSIIYVDDENERSRIPSLVAKKHFDLSGLEPLYLFNKDNKLLSKAHINRVEFLQQNISPVFIAVYKTDTKINEKRNIVLVVLNLNLLRKIMLNIKIQI